MLPLLYLFSRSPILYLFVVLCFIPPLIICLARPRWRLVVFSLILLAISQYGPIVSAEPVYGEAWFSDSMIDYRIADIITQSTHFTVGQVGDNTRTYQYSSFPAIHVLAASSSKVIALDPFVLWRFILLPLLCVVLVFSLLTIFTRLGATLQVAGISVIIFLTSYSSTFFHSQFVRESLAFPMMLLVFALFLKFGDVKKASYIALTFAAMLLVVMGHHFTSYMMVAFLVLFALFSPKNSRYLRFVALAIGLVAFWGFFVSISASQGVLETGFKSVLDVFTRAFSSEQTSAIMPDKSLFNIFFAIAQYAMLLLLGLFGLRKLFSLKMAATTVFVFTCTGLFFAAMLIRFYNVSFVGGLGQRILSFSFVGLALLASFGLVLLYEKIGNAKKLLRLSLFVIIIAVMAVGSLAQQSSWFTSTLEGQPRQLPFFNRAVYLGAEFLNKTATENAYVVYNVAPADLPVDEYDVALCLGTYGDVPQGNWYEISRVIDASSIYFVRVDDAYFIASPGNFTASNYDIVYSTASYDLRVSP